jgi:hypothetical protein
MTEAQAVAMVTAMLRVHLAGAIGHREEMVALRIVRALARYDVAAIETQHAL